MGTILGTQLSDLIFEYLPIGAPCFAAMFGGAATLGLVHMWNRLLVDAPRCASCSASPHGPFRLLFRYWPGPIVLVAVAMGAGFVVTTVFLTRFATAMNLAGSPSSFCRIH